MKLLLLTPRSKSAGAQKEVEITDKAELVATQEEHLTPAGDLGSRGPLFARVEAIDFLLLVATLATIPPELIGCDEDTRMIVLDWLIRLIPILRDRLCRAWSRRKRR